MNDSPRPRRVLILGRDAALDIEPIARQAAADGAELVLLSLGRPVTASQTKVLRDAQRLAKAPESRLILEQVVATVDEVVGLARPAQQVTVVASGEEWRSLERALAAKELSSYHPPAVPERALSPGARQPFGNARRRLQADRTPGERSSRGEKLRPQRRKAPGTAAGGGHGMGASDTAEGRADDTMPAGAANSESVEALIGRQIAEPVLGTAWTRQQAKARKRAPFRVYLAAAPGAGKTLAMLGEGQRRKARGSDVVVGAVYTYDRPRTIEALKGLEIVPPRTLSYRGTTFEEMDVEAVIARRPEVVLIDELAHTNIPGSRRAKRWEDVLDVLPEGITVISTVNVQHLASLNDVVARVTGIRQQETVPDWVLELADQVELVDISPYALRRRMIHGNIYPDPHKAELALQRYFTMENLTALRELALMRVANQVDEELLRRWSKAGAPDTRERILVCVSRPTVAEDLVRRGARIAQRARGELLVVHAAGGDGDAASEWQEQMQGMLADLDGEIRIVADAGSEWQEQMRRLVADLGGEFRILTGEDPVEAVLTFAYQQHVTQIVVGESLRPRWRELLRGSFVNRLIRKAANVDIHVIARAVR